MGYDATPAGTYVSEPRPEWTPASAVSMPYGRTTSVRSEPLTGGKGASLLQFDEIGAVRTVNRAARDALQRERHRRAVHVNNWGQSVITVRELPERCDTLKA